MIETRPGRTKRDGIRSPISQVVAILRILRPIPSLVAPWDVGHPRPLQAKGGCLGSRLDTGCKRYTLSHFLLWTSAFVAEGTGPASRAYLFPEVKQALFEPREHRGIIPYRLKQLPVGRLGVRAALVVAQHDPSKRVRLALPLVLRQQEPVDRVGQATFHGSRQEGVRVADKADLAPAQTRLLPDQAHEAIRVGTRGGIALPISDQQESRLPWSDVAFLESTQKLASKTLDKQGMGEIYGIVPNQNSRVPASGSAQLGVKCRPLADIQLEGDGQDTQDRSTVADSSIDDSTHSWKSPPSSVV